MFFKTLFQSNFFFTKAFTNIISFVGFSFMIVYDPGSSRDDKSSASLNVVSRRPSVSMQTESPSLSYIHGMYFLYSFEYGLEGVTIYIIKMLFMSR